MSRHTPPFTFARRTPGVYFPPRRFSWTWALLAVALGVAIGATLLIGVML